MKVTKSLTAVIITLMVLSCFISLYKVENASAVTNGTIIFRETGLASGTSWIIRIGSGNVSTSNSQYSTTWPSGSPCNWVIYVPTGYTSTSTLSGSTSVSVGQTVYVDVTFAASFYAVTFAESGLVSGTSWSLNFNGKDYTSITNIITVSNVTNGNYPYLVNVPTGYDGAGTSGTLTVNNANVARPVAFSPQSGTWYMAGDGLTRTGASYYPGALTNNQLWSHSVGSLDSSPAVSNGILYSTSGSYLTLLNITTGSEFARYDLGFNILACSPAVVNDVVYVGSYAGTMYAINGSTGSTVWSFPTGSQIWSFPAVANGVVYFGSYNHVFYALNATSGDQIWSYTTGNVIQLSPSILNGLVYVPSSDGKIYALNMTSGASVWNFTLTSSRFAQTPAIWNGTIYTSMENGTNAYIIAIDALTGQQKWIVSGEWSLGMMTVGDGILFVKTNGMKMYVHNATDGSALWDKSFFENPGDGAPAYAAGVVYYQDQYSIYAANATTGNQLWSANCDTMSSVTPGIIVVNGTVYASDMGAIHAFGSTSNYKTLTTSTVGQGEVLPGNQSLPTGSQITLQAVPKYGWHLEGWSGDASGNGTITVTLDSNKAFTATFVSDVPSYSLTMVTIGQGSVQPGNASYTQGTDVSLVAIPDAGWHFSGWSGDVTGSANTTITMNADKAVNANFTRLYNLTAMVYLNNTLQSTENYTYIAGARLNISSAYLEIPNALYLEHWDLDGTVGYNSSLTLDMTKDYTIKAYLLIKTFQLNITQSTGGSTSPTNDTYTYTYGSTATVTATPAESDEFTHWLLDGEISSTDPEFSIDMYANHTLTAVFSAKDIPPPPPPPPPPPVISYPLTLNSATGGTTDLSVGVHVYNAGSVAAVTATASVGYQFSYWLLDGVASNAGATIQVIMNSAHTLTPVFTPIATQLTVTSAIGGSTAPDAGTYTYSYGNEVSVTANATTGYAFNYWLLDGETNSATPTITLTLTANHTLTPVFTQLTYQLTVNTANGGSTSMGSGTYTYGETATVTATPSEGYLFNNWELDGQTAGTAPSISIHMTANHTLTPIFTPITYTLTIVSTVGGSTNPATGSYTYNHGQTAAVTAIAADDYRFERWLLDGQNATASSTISLQLTSNHTLTAVFAEIPVVLVATETTAQNITYPIAISGGNMTAKQMTNMTITPYATNTTTVVALNVTGPSGTVGTGTLALPKEAIPYGTIPQVYIDGVLAENQTYTEDTNYFYITFTTHFSEHAISIVFATPAPPPTPTPTPTPTTSPSTTPTITPTPTSNPTSTPQSTATPTPTSGATVTPTATPITPTEAAFPSYLVVAFAAALALLVLFALVYRRKKKEDA